MKKRTSLLSAIGALYFNIGNLRGTEKTYVWYLNLIETNFGKDALETSNCFYLIGSFYLENNYLKKSLACFRRALKIRVKNLGKEHTSVSDCYYNIGLILYLGGRQEKALDWIWNALAIRIQNCGEENIHVAKIYEVLGLIFMESGDDRNAIEKFKSCLKIKHALLSNPNHPEILSVVQNLKILLEKIEERKLEKKRKIREMELKEKIGGSNAQIDGYVDFLKMKEIEREKRRKKEKQKLAQLFNRDAFKSFLEKGIVASSSRDKSKAGISDKGSGGDTNRTFGILTGVGGEGENMAAEGGGVVKKKKKKKKKELKKFPFPPRMDHNYISEGDKKEDLRDKGNETEKPPDSDPFRALSNLGLGMFGGPTVADNNQKNDQNKDEKGPFSGLNLGIFGLKKSTEREGVGSSTDRRHRETQNDEEKNFASGSFKKKEPKKNLEDIMAEPPISNIDETQKPDFTNPFNIAGGSQDNALFSFISSFTTKNFNKVMEELDSDRKHSNAASIKKKSNKKTPIIPKGRPPLIPENPSKPKGKEEIKDSKNLEIDIKPNSEASSAKEDGESAPGGVVFEIKDGGDNFRDQLSDEQKTLLSKLADKIYQKSMYDEDYHPVDDIKKSEFYRSLNIKMRKVFTDNNKHIFNK